MKTAIIGANGAVGRQLQELLSDHDPLLFSLESTPSYEGINIAFFCVPDEIARREIPKAKECGAFCIDASSTFRLDPEVPLVIPEVNGYLLEKEPHIVSSPNCTTTLMLLPLTSIHRSYGIKRIVATTYQALSGAGFRGIQELEAQLAGADPSDLFPHPCAHNVFLHESKRGDFGYAGEEEKMELETRKILEDNTIGVTARCVRVPVFRAHSIALNVELHTPFDLQDIRKSIENARGVIYQDDVSPLDATYQKSVFCGNLRRDKTQNHTLELWVCGDQLLKGAALNMFQLATALCSI